jgi:integrase/recombinase XerD
MLPKLFERFLHHQEILNRSQNTISAYRQNLILFCKYFNFANDVSATDLGKVSASDSYEFMGSLKSKNGKSLAPASIQQIMATIKIFYEYLMELKMISENPARNIKTPTKAKTLPKFLNEQQIIDAINSVTPEKYESMKDAIERNFEIAQTYLIAEDYIYKNFIENAAE